MRIARLTFHLFIVVGLAAGLFAQQPASPSSVQFGPPITITSPLSGPDSIAVGDFNNDHIPDLILVQENFEAVWVALGNGDGTFGPWLGGTSFTPGPRYVAVGDLNQDGNLDAVTVDSSGTYLLGVSLGNGRGGFYEATTVGVWNNFFPLFTATVADLNGDGIPDVVVPASQYAGRTTPVGAVYVLLGTGHGFQPLKLFRSGGQVPMGLAVADVNGDGIPDVVVTNSLYFSSTCCANVGVLLGNGDGTFGPAQKFPAGVDPLGVVVGDFNGDGKPDIAAINNGAGLAVLLGNGDGTFGPPAAYASGQSPVSIVAADFNGDGKLDLAVANSPNMGSSYVSVLLGNGDGSFQPPLKFEVGRGPFQVVTADFNGDGKPDLATVNASASTVSVLLNTTPWPSDNPR